MALRCSLALLASPLAAAVLTTSSPALAQPSAALNRYVPAAHPRDGFGLSHAEMGSHLGWSAGLHIDYANDPLVYENSIGDSDSELVSLVSDQVTAHFLGTLGLLESVQLAIEIPVHLVMKGQALGQQPTATGFGPGDLRLGAMLSLHHSALASAAFSGVLTAATGEAGEDRPGVAGDSGATFATTVHVAVHVASVTLLGEVGARFRGDQQFAGVRFTDVMTYGLGAELALVPDVLRTSLEAQGESPLDNVGDRASSPLGALIGMKLSILDGLELGLAGGAGLLRGYGSPDTRIVMSVGYAQDGPKKSSAPQQEPGDQPSEALPEDTEPSAISSDASEPLAVDEATLDSDGDGMADMDDSCPELPGGPEDNGCAQYLQYDSDTGALTLTRQISFADASVQTNKSPALDEIVAFLRANPKARVRIEAHTLPPSGRSRDSAISLSVRRAQALGEWLIAQGIAGARLEIMGCGDARPVAPQRGSQRHKNERVELWVLEPLPARGMHSSMGCIGHSLAPETEAPKPPPAVKAPPPPAPATPVAPKPAPPAPAVAPAPAPTPAPAAAPAPKVQAAPIVVGGAVSAAAVLAALANAPKEDADRDGVPNAEDSCPLAPGSNDACPETHRVHLDKGEIELLTPLRFEEGGVEIKGKGSVILDELAATLRANPKMKIMIAAHTAEEADAAGSLALSQKRAAATRKALGQRGIKDDRVRAMGCGQARPVAPNNVPWGRKKNDRVEVLVLDPARSAGVHSQEGCAPSEGT